MALSDKTLIKKLAVVLILKLSVLSVLWWVFVRDHRVALNANSVAEQFLMHSPSKTLESKP